MSLPPAPKDISAHPAKGSVVDPVNKKAKDADVERKLKFYSTLQAFRQSKLPTNAQLDRWITYAIKNSPIEAHHPEGEQGLSRDGRKLVSDFRDFLETLKVIVNEKNGDEILQEFIWSTRDVETSSLKADHEAGGSGVNKDKAKEDANVAAHHLRTLLHLLLTNSEARKLVSDFSLIGRDLASKGLTKASQRIAPSEQQLRDVDQAHAGDGGAFEAHPREKAKEQEEKGVTGMLQAKLPGRDGQTDQVDPNRADDPMYKQAHKLASHPPTDVAGVKDTAKNLTGHAKREAVDESGAGERVQNMRDNKGQDASASDAREVRDETKAATRDATEEAKKKGLVGRMMGGVRDGLSSQIPQEHQDKGKAHIQRGREFLAEEYFPKERRDQWIWRAKKVVVECQQHPDYQESLRWLLEYVKEYASHGKRVAGKHGGVVQGGVKENDNLQTSLSQLRVLLERFANGRSLQDDVWDPINVLIDDSQRDDELRAWWKNVGDYVEKVLLTPGYVMEDASNDRAKELVESGQRFYGTGSERQGGDPSEGTDRSMDTQSNEGFGDTTAAAPNGIEKKAGVRGKYREHFDRVFEGMGTWVGGIREDRLNKRLGTDVQRFTKDLLFSDDGEGSLRFKKELWNDVRRVIVPMLVDRVGYVPIPRIEYTDDTLDLVVENLTLSGRNLFPNIVEIETHNYLKFSPYTVVNKEVDDGSKNEFKLTLGQIQADMRDVAFYFRKKTGLPKLMDSGLADIVLGGEGLTATVHLTSSKDPSTLFAIKAVHVKVDTLKFAIRDSKHDLLYKTLRPLATGLVKKQIQKAVADGLRTGLEWVGEELVAVRQRMEQARKDAKEGEGQEEIGRFTAMQEAFKHRKDETASTTTASNPHHSQFKVVSNKRNSLLASAGHPAGWVNRAADREKLVEKGEGWRSDAFNVV